MKKKIIILAGLIILVGGLNAPKIANWYQRWSYESNKIDLSKIPTPSPTLTATPTPTPTPTPTSTATPAPIVTASPTPKPAGLPSSILIKGVPFTSQAPHGNWDETHEETCEEASLLIIHKYLQGDRRSRLPADEAEKDLQDIIAWEKQNFGTYFDTTAAQSVQMAKEYYGHPNTYVKYDIKSEDIKKEIAAGNPVIVPAAGRLLKNPYYTAPGPIYHHLVIIGYTSSEFITNDVGTRHGLGFRFPITRVMEAIHDWAGNKDNILEGRKAMIVVK